MGRADVITKTFMSDRQNFADAFNFAFYLYGYSFCIKADDLQELDTTLSIAIPLPDGETQSLGRQCDVFKQLKLFYDDRHYYLALMLENQHYIHSGMPLKLLVYQMLDALKQVREAMHQHDPSSLSSDEFLSDYPKDFKLRPVIPLVIYFGPKPWTAPMDLADLYDDVPQELHWILPSQKYLLLCPRSIDDTQFKEMKSEVSLALGALKHASTRSGLNNFFKNDHDYDKVSRDLCELILANVNYSRSSLALEEANNMYDITHFWDESDQQLRDEGYKAGHLEGIQQTVQGFVRIGLSDQQIQDATGLSDVEITKIKEMPVKSEHKITHFWDESDQHLRDEGYQTGRKEIVKQMLHLNMDMATICQVTGFSEAEVKAIEDGIPHPPLTRHPLPTGEG